MSDLTPRQRQILEFIQDAIAAAKLGREMRLPVLAFRRHAGIELERSPGDIGLDVRPGGEGPFQPALADIAPRADGVGNDVDFHGIMLNRRAAVWEG